MALTVAEFRAQFVAFASSPSDARVQSKLDLAYLRVGDAWGDLRDYGAGYLAAHMIALDPMAENSALAAPANGASNYSASFYLKEYERLRDEARGGFFGAVGGD